MKNLDILLKELTPRYGVKIMFLPDKLQMWKKQYPVMPQKPLNGKSPSAPATATAQLQNIQKPEPPKPKPTFSGAVIPNRNYILKLMKNLGNLNGKLGRMEYETCAKKLNEILKENDFDDAEEIIMKTHGMIEKYIYGSDTKVSAEKWKYLEQYIRDAGYQPVLIHTGDPITSCKEWFARQIPCSGGVSGTIKQVQLLPYRLFFEQDDELEEVRLYGKCIFYR